jgi:hypothetical protein
MKPTEKIEKWLEEISQEFGNIHLVYVYMKEDDDHNIYVDPNEEYINGEFGKKALKFNVQLIKEFPDISFGFLPMEKLEEEEKEYIIFDSTKRKQKQFSSLLKNSLPEKEYSILEIVFNSKKIEKIFPIFTNNSTIYTSSENLTKKETPIAEKNKCYAAS